MSTKDELVFNYVLLAFQVSLGIWQFIKITPVGALIKGTIGWLLRPLGLFPVYARLQSCPGCVFKKANYFVLQVDIPSERLGISMNENNTINLHYLRNDSILRMDGNMLYRDDKMCYYITRKIWKELQTLGEVLSVGIPQSRTLASAATFAAAARAAAAVAGGEASAAYNDAAAYDAAYYDAAAAAYAYDDAAGGAAAAYAADDDDDDAYEYAAARRDAAAARDAATAAARDAAARADAVARAVARAVDAADADAVRAEKSYVPHTVFVRGSREFWEEVITGGFMSLEEILDGVILDNKHVSLRLNDDWLLPVNLSVSEEKLLKIINLLGLFLQTKTVKVHWLIPTSLSLVSALMEFSTKIRVWIYTNINVVFCYVMHCIFDPRPRWLRRQVYSLGKWVEKLKPCNDMQLKVVRGNMRAIISEAAKVDKEGATLVLPLQVADSIFIQKQFRCEPIEIDITCSYARDGRICRISAPTISVFYMNCMNLDDFIRISTLVSLMAENGSGSLISCGPDNKVRVRGFKESVITYANSGYPPIYKLELGDVVVA